MSFVFRGSDGIKCIASRLLNDSNFSRSKASCYKYIQKWEIDTSKLRIERWFWANLKPGLDWIKISGYIYIYIGYLVTFLS